MTIRKIIVPLFLVLGLSAVNAACSSTSNGGAADGGSSQSPDGGSPPNNADAGDSGGNGNGVLSFTPSNLDLSGIDLSQIVDEDVASTCELRGSGATSCFNHPAFATITQSDGSKIGVYVVKSVKIEPTGHINVSGLTGNYPVAIVSLGDFTVLGNIDAHSSDIHGTGGGFESIANQNGVGPGGGPKGDDKTAGGGGSYCGQGGQGNVVFNSGATPGPKTPASGNPEIVPLRGGASGGGGGSQGGAGGGGVQLVANGTFSLAAGSYINVGGGGGGGGVTAGGGGAGGSLLIEATTVKIAGIIAANGGGGGGSGVGVADGKNGTPDSTPAAAGAGTVPAGAGSGGATIDGESAPAATVGTSASGGGGGAGRIRLNSKSGAADLTGSTFSPTTSTACVTQGTLK